MAVTPLQPRSAMPLPPLPAHVSPDLGAKAQAALRHLFGPNGQFKSTTQANAAMAILAQPASKASILCVLPTGAGKALLNMLPCLVEPTKVMVLVVPYVALTGDTVRRLKQFRIKCAEWKQIKTSYRSAIDRETRLVLVSAEEASSVEFLKFTKLLCSLNSLSLALCLMKPISSAPRRHTVHTGIH
ncbi:hypothetical protein DM01DRAFT_323429 [Hesseltinella vesiculosa]|uniref:DEAD/DEAH-box helicase domain-containing protein n=1 Tax=Hesseltinella vesiculosa TaxID=101127 RepID=A0A1X2GMS4_9FUNG|nr:hypothetical protein DM01DRAFT_323429 [Hesseltinella vesiculosa]